ncbi:MAG TPA: J domain-containing protein [Acidimicrobiales bacterium]|nr:J domain-containing protein [Acidimicrobiales bacterium]
MTDPYATLGVDPAATDAEIRRAYLALARRFHPDNNPDGEERMRAVNEAWAVLGDPDRRRRHDGARRPDVGFRPHDPVDDGFDPRAQPDIPYRPRSTRQVRRQGVLTVAPVGVFAAAVGAGIAGLLFESPMLLGGGVVLFGVACIGMVVVLLAALVDARRDEG